MSVFYSNKQTEQPWKTPHSRARLNEHFIDMLSSIMIVSSLLDGMISKWLLFIIELIKLKTGWLQKRIIYLKIYLFNQKRERDQRNISWITKWKPHVYFKLLQNYFSLPLARTLATFSHWLTVHACLFGQRLVKICKALFLKFLSCKTGFKTLKKKMGTVVATVEFTLVISLLHIFSRKCEY